ncbi:MAG: Gfo/Idh/MocA family oxidoreductase [Rubripirellula sp.]
MRRFARILGCCLLFAICANGAHADDAAATTIRIGLIGLDTSHSPALVKTFNDPNPKDDSFAGQRIVAAYPFGSRTIESSASRIPKYTEEVEQQGVKIVDSIDELLAKVDCVLLETNDGTLHLEQALEIFRASKPVFIDKPTGSNLAEVIAIFRAAQHYEVPMFSSSSLRFSSGAQAIRNGKVGRVLGCSSYSPCAIEPSHVDLFWYGIHGVETLYTCMGSGCESVAHSSTDDFEFASGIWDDGRIGTCRGIRSGKSGYGGIVFGEKSIEDVGTYDGYRPLFVEIAKFFRTQQSPIDDAETIEIYAFMQAASESKDAGGVPIKIEDVMNTAEQTATELLSNE